MIGAGPVSAHDLTLIKSTDARIVALDGGANHLAGSLVPDLIIGDLDSIMNLEDWQNKTQVIEATNQNYTDLEKALTHEIEACEQEENQFFHPFLCFGLLGGRFDQSLTVLHTCLKFADQRMIFFGQEDLVMPLPVGRSQLELPKGSRVSLFPLLPTKFGCSRGLFYPIDGMQMQIGSLIGTSNEASDANIEISLISGACLLILDRSSQDLVLDQLSLQT